MFGISADYKMRNGEKSMAIVMALPIEYISTMLETEEEDALMYSHIIRQDGSFIVSGMNDEYDDYFSSLYGRYKNDDPKKIEAFVEELTDAMKKGKIMR